MARERTKRRTVQWLAAATLLATWAPLWAQSTAGQGGDAVLSGARAAAPFDPSGYWVAIVTQDWEFRMVVPQRGQYTDVPLTLKAKQFADAWQPGADEATGKQCEAYGAAAIMQVPGRLHISWQDPDTLQVQTDAGTQTRLLHFVAAADGTNAPPSRQGYSLAQWVPYREAGAPPPQRAIPPGTEQQRNVAPARAAPSHYGWLQVVTTNMLAGLLRKNGVPYSAQTHMTENWVMNNAGPDYGGEWLTVTTILRDPQYLVGQYVQNALFDQEPDGSTWDPTPCTLR
jgi:hypothetical protein